MATSPNYGWLEPDNTDLVKNGALAIRTLGNAIDTTMATMVPKSIVDAKGDLIAGTAADTAARLAVGNNGETLVADSSTSTGLRWQGHIEAGKNALINGALDVWQRGTTYTGTANAYVTADRWYMYASTSTTFAQETTVVPSGCQYSMKMTVGASASVLQGYQAIETLNAVQFAGQNVTLSMNFQASVSTAINITLEYSTTVDKALATGGWVPITATSGGSGTATVGSFATISGVYAMPSTAKSIRVVFATASSMASGAILYWSKSQLELGSVITTFSRAGGTIQGELAACQRYYWRASAAATSNVLSTMGTAYNTSGVIMSWQNPVPMRVKASSIDYSALEVADFVNAGVGITSASADGNSTPSNSMSVIGVSGTPLTQYRNYAVRSSSSSGYVGFSAEL